MKKIIVAVVLALPGCLAPPSELSQRPLYEIVEQPRRNVGAIEFLATDGTWHRVRAEQ